jgi:hypothetical protein
MSYFRELPDIEYQSQLPTKNSSLNYVRVKNLFRRVKLRDDLQNVFTLFNKYQIKDGERPDTIAENLYGSSDLDWVVLLSANIINARDSWPLSNRDLYKFVEEKYGIDVMNEVKYYQTTQVKNSKGNLILPAGKVVDKDFSIPNPDNPYNILNPVVGVSYYDYEVEKNNKKRTIYILKPQYLQQYLNDIRSIMYYEKSSQYINTKLIRTENTNNTSP